MSFVPQALAGGSVLANFGSTMYQAQVAKNNSKIADQNAQSASDAAQAEQVRSDRESAELEGQQLAIQSASGLNLMGRTSVAVRDSSHAVGREAAVDIQKAGASEARGFQQQAANFRGQAKMLKIKAAQDLTKDAAKAYASMAGGSSSTSSGSLY
jgi:hypothetical protein